MQDEIFRAGFAMLREAMDEGFATFQRHMDARFDAFERRLDAKITEADSHVILSLSKDDLPPQEPRGIVNR